MAAQFTNSAGSMLLKIDGQATYITYTHLEDYDWVIMHLIPQSEIDGQTSLIGMVTLICLIICLVLVIAYAIVYSRQVVMPVRAIIHQFQLFQTGVVNWNRSLPVPGKDEIGELVRWFNTFSDSLLARQAAENRLRHEAFYDLLTDLPNRSLFMDRLEQAIFRSQRNKDEHFAVLFMDIDHFKLINDSLGHSVGDDLLKAVAERLGKCLRTSDTVARLGGDEFVMLLNSIPHIDEATYVAERVLKAISSPVELSGHQVVISTSIGILFSDPSYDSPMAYLRDADIAMYWAKSQGKARYEIFTASMRESVVYRMGLETDLRKAIEAGQIQVHYQPIISLQTGQIHSFEALLRWTHPRLGPVSPTRFIEVAEETGLIHALGQLVLREACYQTAAWQRALALDTPLMVNVNISRRQFIQKDLVERISTILAESELAAEYLNLEVTESVIMQDMRATGVMLDQLKELGVRIEMDDFGSGYSSLNHLTRFKFDVIKIDRTFVNETLTDQRQAGLVQSIISMAHSLGMVVVAEGIENEEQMAWLKACGCEYGQGYLFSPALDSQEAFQFLQKNLARVN
jgi:diguanylate cyclase (GGDEF)-like protein